MQIESTQEGARAVIRLIGRMDAQSATEFEAACASWTEKKIYDLILDMTGLQYISSLGLRSFVVIGQQTRQNGGTLRLCGMTGLVKQVFDITRVASLFPMYDSVESALAAE